MHVMTKYLDTRAAAINALQDFALMEQAAALNATGIEDELRADLVSPPTNRADGMPRTNNPKAGEARLCATLDKIDLLHERKREAREYLDWFLPAWALLTDDERYLLEAFFLSEGSREDAVTAVSERFYIERSSAHDKKNRALRKFATALYGKL
ncbi:hypothetical protein V3M63_06565 [Trueperella pyogenes]|uniref:hypothetical protein n=1 Tax=Trueperella pyogenes TaxID=1661 RepID=UPI00345D9B55